MKKQVYSNKTTIGILSFCLLVCIGIMCLSIVLIITKIRASEWNMVILATVMGCVFLAVTGLTVYILNRAGCKIIYDSDQHLLYREGLWRGYKYQLKAEDITEIVVVFLPQDDTYYLLLDPYQTRLNGYSSNAFIRLKETPENLEFIRNFWDKPINTSDYKSYDGYTKLITDLRK